MHLRKKDGLFALERLHEAALTSNNAKFARLGPFWSNIVNRTKSQHVDCNKFNIIASQVYVLLDSKFFKARVP
jgi:hypothetical protein